MKAHPLPVLDYHSHEQYKVRNEMQSLGQQRQKAEEARLFVAGLALGAVTFTFMGTAIPVMAGLLVKG